MLTFGGHHVEHRAFAQLLPLLQREVAHLVAFAQHTTEPGGAVKSTERLFMHFTSAVTPRFQRVFALQLRRLCAFACRLGSRCNTRVGQGDVDQDAQTQVGAALITTATTGGQGLAAANGPAQLRLVTTGHRGSVLSHGSGLCSELRHVGGACHFAFDHAQLGHFQQQAGHALHTGQAVTDKTAQARFYLPHLRERLVLRQLSLLQALLGLHQLAGAAAIGAHDGL